MTCCGHTINGQTPVDKIWVERQSVAGLGNPIDFNWTAPTWVKLIQIEANWDAVPTTSEFLTVWKNHSAISRSSGVWPEFPRNAKNYAPDT